MAKTNLQIMAERVYEDSSLWNFLKLMIDYYVSLRRFKYEDLAKRLGYSNKSSLAALRGGRFTPEQVERLIEFLTIEDADANRIRARYWAAFCNTEPRDHQFNRLYAPDAESIIRELTFENERLKSQYEDLASYNAIATEVAASLSVRTSKKKP